MARRGRAFALLKLGRIEEAEIEFKSALWWAKRNQQSQAVFHTSLGEFYLETKHWQKAINSFKNAQREFPHHYRNHWGIGKAQLGLGDLKEAAHALKLALEDKDLKSPAKEEVTILHAQISELLNPGTD
jgi:tetratricopeptide (TPR) repeat protein